MNSDTEDTKKNIDPMQFAQRFFKAHGAVLDIEKDLTHVLLPHDLAASMSLDELIAITSDRESLQLPDLQKIYPVQFQTPLLDRMISMAGDTPPFLHASLKFDYIKTQGFEHLIKEQFEFHKSKIKVIKTGQTKTRYLLLTCRYRAKSDEIKEGLQDICFNLDSLAAIPDMDRAVSYVQKEYPEFPARGCTKKEIEKIYEWVSRYSHEITRHSLSSFKKSMNRRFKRDAASLDEYYTALEKEMAKSLSRGGVSQGLLLERKEKMAMIPDELAAKKEDLLNKYSISIDIRPVAALLLTSPCVTVLVRLMAGKNKINISMTYNPSTKKIDPLVCKACGTATYHIGCSSDMRINCLSCLDQGSRSDSYIQKKTF